MGFPTSPTLDAAAFDVARSLYAYRRYGGSQTKALAALRRRASGFSADEYALVLTTFVELYRVAQQAVADNVLAPSAERTVAAFADIDHAACMKQLDAIRPGDAVAVKEQILGWSIMYWYLK